MSPSCYSSSEFNFRTLFDGNGFFLYHLSLPSLPSRLSTDISLLPFLVLSQVLLLASELFFLLLIASLSSPGLRYYFTFSVLCSSSQVLTPKSRRPLAPFPHSCPSYPFTYLFSGLCLGLPQ